MQRHDFLLPLVALITPRSRTLAIGPADRVCLRPFGEVRLRRENFCFSIFFDDFFFRIKMRTNCVDSARFGSVLSRLDRVPPRVSQSAPGPTRARNPLHTARDPFKICQNVASRKSRFLEGYSNAKVGPAVGTRYGPSPAPHQF